MTELKKLLFAPPYPRILFTGEKNKTFRVTSGERYNPGDIVSFCFLNNEEFAQATITRKYRKKFKDLNEEDWRGHERFQTPLEMYKTYSSWEGFSVGPETELDIIEYRDFRLTTR